MALHIEMDKERVAFKGALDVYSAEDARLALLASMLAGTGFDLDLSGVTEIDYAGVQLLLAVTHAARQRKMEVRCTQCSETVSNALALLHLMAPEGAPFASREMAVEGARA